MLEHFKLEKALAQLLFLMVLPKDPNKSCSTVVPTTKGGSKISTKAIEGFMVKIKQVISSEGGKRKSREMVGREKGKSSFHYQLHLPFIKAALLV